MIFGDPYKFALYLDNFLYIESMSDWDCMCGYYINGTPCISDSSQMLYTQKESILGGCLKYPKESELLFNSPLETAFKALIKHRYPNYVGLSESRFLEVEWVEPEENYLIYDAHLESSIFGTIKYNLFVIKFDANVRVISYIGSSDYYDVESLTHYSLKECYLTAEELDKIILDLYGWLGF